jgi:predicted hydrocarbon binding protein
MVDALCHFMKGFKHGYIEATTRKDRERYSRSITSLQDNAAETNSPEMRHID